ncbi:hypothetical protein SK608_1808 [Streptococcus mitis subsp. carlssonii]|uniref:Uncharacterized protein n=1 Tax=Streptococcus mitis TaxID=28037 RepID=A0A081QM05_STRMT|nr:hypothetical protein SK608_1808 [Streptococcus mitis]
MSYFSPSIWIETILPLLLTFSQYILTIDLIDIVYINNEKISGKLDSTSFSEILFCLLLF